MFAAIITWSYTLDSVGSSSSKLVNIAAGTSWTPVLNLGNGKAAIGFTEDGIWVVEGGSEALLDICALEGTYHTLVLLESRIEDVKKVLAELRAANPSRSKVTAGFPFKEIVAGGMKQGSDYWAALAVNWFPVLSEEDRKSLEPLLLHVSRAKWATQETRHAALKMRAQQNRRVELTPARKNTAGDRQS